MKALATLLVTLSLGLLLAGAAAASCGDSDCRSDPPPTSAGQ